MSLALLPAREAIVRTDYLGFPAWQIRCPSCDLPGVIAVPLRRECIECAETRIKDAPENGYWLYRLFSDLPRRLLYVGTTRNPRARIRAHWLRWPFLIDDVEWEPCFDERDMLAREARAITLENPALNVQHPRI